VGAPILRCPNIGGGPISLYKSSRFKNGVANIDALRHIPPPHFGDKYCLLVFCVHGEFKKKLHSAL